MLFIFVLLALGSASAVEAASGTYVALKGGLFLPNGQGGSVASSEDGFSSFSTGYNVEVAAGFRPESYAALELGSGYYATSLDVANLQIPSATRIDAYAVPITLTAKGILPLGELEFFAGAGLGYWFGQLHFKNAGIVGGAAQVKDVNAGALGYQVLGGADYRVSEAVNLGVEAKWVFAKPEFDFTDITGHKVKWQIGGTTINLVAKYNF